MTGMSQNGNGDGGLRGVKGLFQALVRARRDAPVVELGEGFERGVMAAIRREARAPADRGAVEAGLFERLAVRFAWGCGALAAASGTYAVFLARNLDVEALRLSCSGASYFLGYGLGGAF